MSENDMPNQSNGCSEHYGDYLQKAAEACAAGDLVLGMHLYLAAYEAAAADPSIPDGMALAGLHEAWHLACDLKERSMAEYVFEKLEPFLMPEEIAEYAGELQNLALDRLEQIGFSREDLQDMAQMITQDLAGNVAMKVESIEIPHAEIFSVTGVQANSQAEEAGEADDQETGADVSFEVEIAVAEDSAEGEPDRPHRSDSIQPSMGLASADDFNPYDMYRDYSIGKSWHAATNEGSGAEVFTRDEERAEAHAKFLEEGGPATLEAKAEPKPADETDAAPKAEETPSADEVKRDQPEETAQVQKQTQPTTPVVSRGIPSMPAVPEVGKDVFSYSGLAGYDETISIMRDLGVGMQHDKSYLDFVAMLNEQHGLDRAPAVDTLLFRAPVLEDAARFVEATIGELHLPALRMSIEENVQGMPVLCVTTDGSNRPRMNHAHNRFEGPAILVIEDLDIWTTPEIPEVPEGGLNAFMMANLSRGAREAVNLIRSAVEDPDVYVLATATTYGEVDPFYYELLEPMTVIDIGLPNDKERADIWREIAHKHPSMRAVNSDDLVRYSEGISRFDLYIAARDAIEEAYKMSLVKRRYVAVSSQNIFEKLAACQPLESDEYRAIEDRVISSFLEDLDHLEDLLDDSQE